MNMLNHFHHFHGIIINKSGNIDLLLGVSVYSFILENSLKKGHIGNPIAQKPGLYAEKPILLHINKLEVVHSIP